MDQSGRPAPFRLGFRTLDIRSDIKVQDNQPGRQTVEMSEEVLERQAVGVLIKRAGPVRGGSGRVVPTGLLQRPQMRAKDASDALHGGDAASEM